jgi:hypothetical protein
LDASDALTPIALAAPLAAAPAIIPDATSDPVDILSTYMFEKNESDSGIGYLGIPCQPFNFI